MPRRMQLQHCGRGQRTQAWYSQQTGATILAVSLTWFVTEDGKNKNDN